MKRSALLAAVLMLATLPLLAEERHQSYFSYDDGGTIVLQGDDGREIDVRVNVPVYPGDQVVTNRRGRSEIRLSDGNVVALDRSTALLFRSILDSYEGEAQQTVAELKYGKAMVFHRDTARDALRLDTASASYFANAESIFAVEADDTGRDRVMVFEGQIEVRTPARKMRLRTGESATVDDRGPYGVVGNPRTSGDDFERWFMRRAEKYTDGGSRYLDSRFSHYDEELRGHGSWVYAGSYGGWVWRPVVSVGWRPYYNGRWSHSRGGMLTWVSYEPWGWLPYHYGRWAHDPGYGWVWLPGTGYAPAWVYWMYGPSYIGWAPAGWYDCYRPYYRWAGQPYSHVGADRGFGFYGRVRVGEVDLRPWTFVEPNGLVSGRIDRAALTTEAIRSRLSRGDTGSFATVSNTPARFTREQFRDPAAAINGIARRGLGTGSNVGSSPGRANSGTGTSDDLTPFFRRDAELPNSVRDRIIRQNPAPKPPTSTATTQNGSPIWTGSSSPSAGSGLAPIGRGEAIPVGRGELAPIGRGELAPIGRTNGGATAGGARGTTGDAPAPERSAPAGRIRRGGDWRNEGGTTSGGTVDRDKRVGEPSVTTPTRPRAVDRDRVREIDTPPAQRGDTPRGDTWRSRGGERTASPEAPEAGTAPAPRDQSWRGRAAGRDAAGTERSGSDVPRRVIEGIGGARVTSGDSGRRSSGSSGTSRPAEPRGERPAVSRDSSGSSGRSAAPAPAPAPPRSTGSAERSEGGRIKRDQ